MAVKTVNNLYVSPTGIEAVEQVMSAKTANGTYTVADMSQYAWLILIGEASDNPNASIAIPYKQFAQLGSIGAKVWLVSYYGQTSRKISVRYVNDTTVTVADRSNENISIMGVK